MTQAPPTLRHQVCTVTVMDTTDPDITFDENGVCNHVHDFRAMVAQLPTPAERDRKLNQMLDTIRAKGKGRDFDCVLGLSGGVDSSFLAYQCREWELRPLVMHFDNGWNSELAVKNIEEAVTRMGYDLETYVMDWEEFRDVQRAYFLASVVDIEVPTDQFVFGALNKAAAKNGIKAILSGNNWATEWVMPKAWNYRKRDTINLQNIHAKFGTKPLRHSTLLGIRQQIWYQYIRGIGIYDPLDLIDYSKAMAKQVVIDKLGWRDYGGKHYESTFTRFYQGYILPKKFGIDKRRAHLSNLILTGEITRDEALAELQRPPYDEDTQAEDYAYVAKKLGFAEEEFDRILAADPIPHSAYGSDIEARKSMMKWVRRLSQTRNTLLRRKLL
jgi:N-acetyl sugar amidotransferase